MSGLRIVKNISMVLVVAVAVSLAGCADGDMATVRIEFKLPDSAKIAYAPSMFDKLISFITLSRPLSALPPYDQNVKDIIVDVTGPGMVAITQTIAVSSGFIELEIPSGNNRTITIRAGDADPVEGWWYYGNETIIDLTPGQQVTLQPLMLDIPQVNYAYKGYSDESLEISWSISDVLLYSYEIQSSTSPNGPYSTFYPGLGEVSGYQYYEEVSPIQETHYIRVRAVYGNQKGVFSEPMIVEKPS